MNNINYSEAVQSSEFIRRKQNRCIVTHSTHINVLELNDNDKDNLLKAIYLPAFFVEIICFNVRI